MIRFSLFFTLLVALGCSDKSLEKFEPANFKVLHLTSIQTEKRHEERLWIQMENSYNRMLNVAPESVASSDQFNGRLESMKQAFTKEIDAISDAMKDGDNLFYYVHETKNGAEFGYLVERAGNIIHKSGSSGVVWD